MNDELKAAILENRFIDRLRTEMVIDHDDYRNLCAALRRLAAEWQGVAQVDKELVQELYVLAPITNNVAQSLRKHQPSMADEVEEMAVELDALVLQCLS